VSELGDRAAQGRVFGNLGNTHYLLGDFQQAVNYHQQVVSVFISLVFMFTWWLGLVVMSLNTATKLLYVELG